MKKLSLLFFIQVVVFTTSAFAQVNTYIIQLKDKGYNEFSINAPSAYLSQRAIDRRVLYNIPIDSTDLPVYHAYLDSIRLSGNVSIQNVSKWLNLVSIKTPDAAALVKINSFPFVVNSTALSARAMRVVNNKTLFTDKPILPLSTENTNDFFSYGQAYNQIHLNNGEFLHNHGFKGEQMQMAILDAGFYNYKTLPTFDSVRYNDQILGTWDFVSKNESVNEDYRHGMECFSTIAANMPGTFVGTSPHASFYLYRTEDAYTETISEELNWAAAAEKADSSGVNIISSSLGYNTFDGGVGNHAYADMNGDKTICAKATDLAAKKGILALIAAGNEGQKAWHYITTPADADSCLAIGAVDFNRQVAGFSSYGPSSDGQIKPDIAGLGVGVAVANTSTGLPNFGNGTSFATPVIAGIATCLWQAFPEVNNMSIVDVLRRSADRFTNPNDRTGYGIPDAKKAFVELIKQLHTQQVMSNKCGVSIQWTAKAAADMNFIVERKLAADADYMAMTTRYNEGDFNLKKFNFNDDLSLLAPQTVQYRIKMNIASDTSFYLDSATINYIEPCNVYTFIGDGNWNIASNWHNNSIPPDTLKIGNKIIIAPVPDGSCVLNIDQQIDRGAVFIVNTDAKLVIEGNFELQEDQGF